MFMKGRNYRGGSIITDLVQGNFLPIQSVLCRRSNVRFNEFVNTAEDWEYFLELFYAQKVKYLNEVLSSVRLNNQSTKNYRLSMREAQIQLLYKTLNNKKHVKLRGRIFRSLVKYVISFLIIKACLVVNYKCCGRKL